MSSLLSGLATSQGTPNAPDSPRAAAALSAAIVALHAFLRVERDAADRAAATQCLAKLETIRGKKMPGASGGGSGAGNPGGSMPGY